MANSGMSEGFARACEEVLPALCDQVGLTTWLVTARVGADEIPLYYYGADPEVLVRLRWPWSESPMNTPLAGAAPPMAPLVAGVPAYRDARVVTALSARAFIAAPLRVREHVLGGLYGLDRAAPPNDLAQRIPLVETVASLLGTVYEAERRAQEAESQALTDALTGVANRRRWQQVLAAEDQRCARYGSSSGVIVVDVDDLKRVNDSLGHQAGDHLLMRTAQVLRQGSRAGDTVARSGGDEFVVLAVETDREALAAYVRRVRSLLRAARVRASVGWAVRDPAGGLPLAWLAADEHMYRAKRARRARTVQARGVRPPARLALDEVLHLPEEPVDAG